MAGEATDWELQQEAAGGNGGEAGAVVRQVLKRELLHLADEAAAAAAAAAGVGGHSKEQMVQRLREESRRQRDGSRQDYNRPLGDWWGQGAGQHTGPGDKDLAADGGQEDIISVQEQEQAGQVHAAGLDV